MAGFFSKLFGGAEKRPKCTAVIAAAGCGSRMEGVNKLFAPLGGTPVLARTLLLFQDSGCVDEIIIVTRESELEQVSGLVREYGITKASKVLRGGDKRQDSVYIGAMEAAKDAKLIAVHDGARPLATLELVARIAAAAAECGAAIPVVPVKDTIKTVFAGKVKNTPPRSELFAVQTPQIFAADMFKAALTDAIRAGCELTDDSMALERLGISVKAEAGEYENIKITTPEDLLAAEAVLNERKNSV